MVQSNTMPSGATYLAVRSAADFKGWIDKEINDLVSTAEAGSDVSTSLASLSTAIASVAAETGSAASQLQTFLGADSETLAQVDALVQAAASSTDLSTTVANLNALQSQVNSMYTNAVLDSSYAAVTAAASSASTAAASNATDIATLAAQVNTVTYIEDLPNT